MTPYPTHIHENQNLSAAVAWQYETIVRQREQIAAQAAEIERLRAACKAAYDAINNNVPHLLDNEEMYACDLIEAALSGDPVPQAGSLREKAE